MTKIPISALLGMIDQWVEQLEDYELPAKCRQSGIDFFAYMQSRGVPLKALKNLIQQVTGHSPESLHTVDDAKLLKQAIANYEYSVVIAREGEMSPFDAAVWVWGK